MKNRNENMTDEASDGESGKKVPVIEKARNDFEVKAIYRCGKQMDRAGIECPVRRAEIINKMLQALRNTA